MGFRAGSGLLSVYLPPMMPHRTSCAETRCCSFRSLLLRRLTRARAHTHTHTHTVSLSVCQSLSRIHMHTYTHRLSLSLFLSLSLLDVCDNVDAATAGGNGLRAGRLAQVCGGAARSGLLGGGGGGRHSLPRGRRLVSRLAERPDPWGNSPRRHTVARAAAQCERRGRWHRAKHSVRVAAESTVSRAGVRVSLKSVPPAAACTVGGGNGQDR